LTDSLLDGVTRDSLLTLALHKGLTVEERRVSVGELKEGLERGHVREAFGAGTAAVISPIRAIGIDGVNYSLAVVGAEGAAAGTAAAGIAGGARDSGESVALLLKNELDDIRYGRQPDLFGWNSYIDGAR
jgi:branched-chain amino acid aminotransferase